MTRSGFHRWRVAAYDFFISESPKSWQRLNSRSATLLFVAAYIVMGVCLNFRYPDRAASQWFALLPSPDVTALVALFALLAKFSKHIGTKTTTALLLFFFLSRTLRFADGVSSKFYNHFNLYLDLPLVPEFIRLLGNTVGWQWVVVTIPLLLLLAVFSWLLVRWCLRFSVHYVQTAKHRRFVLFAITALVLLSLVVPSEKLPEPKIFARTRLSVPEHYRWGAFNTSVLSRWGQEADFLLHAYGYRTQQASEIARVKQAMESAPSSLDRLKGNNVLLIFVESYGSTVTHRPHQLAQIKPLWNEMEQTLEATGYHVCSDFINSPTYSGRSWLAHSTIATGIRVTDQNLHQKVLASSLQPISTVFRNAGYRTVRAAPGTMRKFPEGEFYQFEQKYYAWHFNYRGPILGWGHTPDQFILDFVHRAEIEKATKPLFIQYELVTSHMPFAVQPEYIEDWSTIGDGSIYNTLEAVTFPVDMASLDRAEPAYMRVILYDLRVLKDYLAKFLKDDTLVIALGDHQPIPEVTGGDESWSAPIHYFSRDADLIAPFAKRGCTPGMHPKRSEPHPPMESFYLNFIQDFSSAPHPRSSEGT